MQGSRRRRDRTDRGRSAGSRGGGGRDARKENFGRPAPVGAGGQRRGGAETAAVFGCFRSLAALPLNPAFHTRSLARAGHLRSSPEWGR